MPRPRTRGCRDVALQELDLRGAVCPETLLRALREVNARKWDLRRGAVALCFRTDSREATVTLPDAFHAMGYRAQVSREGSAYLIVVRAGPERA
jgi:TusA-related sulfurtransferase